MIRRAALAAVLICIGGPTFGHHFKPDVPWISGSRVNREGHVEELTGFPRKYRESDPRLMVAVVGPFISNASDHRWGEERQFLSGIFQPYRFQCFDVAFSDEDTYAHSNILPWENGRAELIPRLSRRQGSTAPFLLPIASTECGIRTDPIEVFINIGPNIHRRQTSGIMKGERNRDGEAASLVSVDDPAASQIGIDPRPLLIAHFADLIFQRKELKPANNRSNDGQGGNGDGSIGRSAGKTILGVFIFALGAALLKVAFYFGDTPRPKRNDRWLPWGTGAFAVALIGQGAFLTMTGNWLP
jgi:hypothetical protein